MKSFLKFILILVVIVVAISVFGGIKDKRKSESFYDTTFNFDNNKSLSITYPGTYKKKEWSFGWGSAFDLSLDSSSCALSDVTLAEISFKNYNGKEYKYGDFGTPENYKKYLERIKQPNELIEQTEQYFGGYSFFAFTHKNNSNVTKKEFVRFYKNGNLVINAKAFAVANNNDCLRTKYPAESDLRFILNNLKIIE